MPEDLLLERPQLGRRLEAELVQGRARIPVRRQGVRLPTRAVEREHLLRAQTLAVRVGGHERFELRGEGGVAAGLELGPDARLVRRQPRLVEARHVGVRELLAGQIGERRPAPEPERRVVRPRVDELLEAVGVELAGLDPHEIPGRARHDPVGAERLAQRVDVHLQRRAGVGGRILAPDRVDQPFGRDGAIRAEEQEREHRTGPPAAERDRLAAVVDHLERPEQPELHDPSQLLLKPTWSRS